jgi:uncharacterized integral membrane protein (TIGR00697 family)
MQHTSYNSKKNAIFYLLASLFIASFIIINLTCLKYFTMFNMPISCEVITYSIASLSIHLILELYGVKRANLLTLQCIIISLLTSLFIYLASSLPISEHSPISDKTFKEMFGSFPIMVLIPKLAYLFSQFIEIKTFSRYHYKNIWIRNNYSILSGQLVYNLLLALIFLLILPITRTPNTSQFDFFYFIKLTAIPYAIKAILSMFINTPLLYFIIRLTRHSRNEKIEHTESQPYINNYITLNEIIYITLLSIFLATIIITNIITSRYFTIKSYTLTSGALTYHLTFLITDITSEIYGKYKARLMVWLGFIVSIFMVIILKIIQIPTAHTNSAISQEIFLQIFDTTPSIVFGSMTAYVVSQLSDIALFDSIKRLTKGKYLWLRNNLSTLISQLLDTATFGLAAWIIWPALTSKKNSTSSLIYSLVINEYIIKMLFIFLSTPIFYLAVKTIKRFIKNHSKTINI